MKKIGILAALLLLAVGASAQATMEEVLGSVEQNNATLAARRKLTTAQTLEARVGNSLENPNVVYNPTWGRPSSASHAGELEVTQSFDFPTSYAHRAQLAKIREQQYGHEYAAYRQQVLFEAQSLCIQILTYRQLRQILDEKQQNARRVVEIVTERLATGDANVLEENKAKYELIAARNAYENNEIELRAAENRLVNLNGGEPLMLAGEHFGVQPELRPMDEMLQVYEESSPELLALMSSREAAERDVKLSRSLSLPKFEAGYHHEYAPGERRNGVVVGMSIPMFGNRNNVKRAKAQSLYAEAELRSGLVDVKTRLVQLYERAALLRSSLEEYRQIDASSRPIELLNKALDAGQISVVDYFTELPTIYEVRQTLVEIERDYQLTCAEINMPEL